MEVTEFGYKPSVLNMRLLISAGLMVAGLVLWYLAGWGFSGFDAVLGAVVTVYFGLRSIGNLREIVFPSPVIRIGEEGLQDRRLGARPIPWEAISEIREVTGQVGGGTVFLEVREPGRYIGPSKGFLWLFYTVRGLSGKGRSSTGFLPLSPPVALDLGDTSLTEAIGAHAPNDIPVSPAGAKS